jgi:YHS domain-containing protein
MGGEKGVDGSLEHAAWYRGRLYLFSSADTRREFVDAPSKFVAED